MSTTDTFILPMSPAQQRLWFLDQLDPGTTVFTIPIAFRLYGTIDLDIVRRTLARLIERHEVLRTRLQSVRGEAMQLIDADATPDMHVHDLSALAVEAQEAALLREVRALVARPFDLAVGPLYRTHVWRMNANSYAFVSTMHHAISDGWSLGVLFREFAQIYAAEAAGLPHALAPLPIQYADYAAWHQARMQSGELDRQRDYWLKQLAGYRGILAVPTDHPRPATQTFDASAYEFRLPDALVDALRAASREANVTLFMTCISAYALLLARYSGQNDLCVGIPVAGRTEADLEALIGFFVSGMVLRFQLDPAQTLCDLLGDVRGTVIEAFSNQDLSVDRLIEPLGVTRHPAYEPLVQATFALQNFSAAPQTLPGIDIEPLRVECMHSRYDLMLLLTETPEGISGNMVYNTHLFERDTITRMMLHLQRILEALATAPQASISAINLVTPAELYPLLGLSPSDDERILPLSPMQRDIYFDTLAHPESRQNSVGGAIEIRHALDLALWQQVLNEVIAQQPVLRSRIVVAPVNFAEPVYQCIRRQYVVALQVIDLEPEALEAANIERRIDDLIRAPYDVHAALLRAIVVRLAAERWVCIIANHHLLLDGIATAQMINLLALEYTRRRAQGEATAVIEALQPSRFHEYLPQLSASIDTPAAIAHWRDALANVSAPHCPAAGQISVEVVPLRQRLEIPAALWADTRQFCRKQGITPQILLKSLYAVLLDAHCQCDGDVMIQEFHAGRPPGHGNTLGCYYQSLPFVVPRTCLHEADLAGLLAHTRQWQKSLANQGGLSIFQQSRLAPRGRTAFMFNYITAALITNIDGQAVEMQRFTPYAEGFVQFEVSMTGDVVHLSLNYDPAIFAEDRFLERMLSLLQQVLAGQTKLAALDLTLPGDLPPTPNWPDVPFVAITEQIRQQALRSPAAAAVIQGDTVLSYAELWQEAEQLAHMLVGSGVQPGDRVGICLDRSPRLIIAVLAALLAGAAYVPMDSSYPQERLQHIARDADCRLVLTQACLRERLAAANCPLLALDDPASLPATSNASLPQRQPDSLFYLLYTSGSTGTPKGAGVTDGGVHHLLNWYRREFAINPADRILLVSAFGFDLTQKNLYAALSTGAALVLPQQASFDVDHIVATAAQHRASLLNCAPSAFYSLLHNPAHYPALASLRFVFLGGEPILIEPMQDWLAGPHCRAQIVNSYGPTECTDVVGWFRLENALDWRHRTVPIGHPVDHVRLHIVDNQLRPTPPFGPGEVAISGPCVGTGYWRNPALTAEKFSQTPLADGPLYRSGDLAYRLPGGMPVFVGRKDFQVKLRGLRIELGEIEAALRDVSGNPDWLVLVRDEQLLALVRSPAAAPDKSTLRSQLSQRLPDYMLPSQYVALAEWPLTPHGKIDRQALLRLPITQAEIARTPPQTATEQALAEIWAEVLNRNDFGRDDSFFDLGGHSLLAARIVSRIRADFAIDLPLRVFFHNASLAAIGAYLDQLRPPVAGADAEVDALLAAMEGLSEEELADLLQGLGAEA